MYMYNQTIKHNQKDDNQKLSLWDSRVKNKRVEPIGEINPNLSRETQSSLPNFSIWIVQLHIAGSTLQYESGMEYRIQLIWLLIESSHYLKYEY